MLYIICYMLYYILYVILCKILFKVILPMGRLQQSSAFGLIILKVNTDLFKKENRIHDRSVLIQTLCSRFPQRYLWYCYKGTDFILVCLFIRSYICLFIHISMYYLFIYFNKKRT